MAKTTTFSLITFLLQVTLLTTVSVWVQYPKSGTGHKATQFAVQYIERRGGQVYYDYQWSWSQRRSWIAEDAQPLCGQHNPTVTIVEWHGVSNDDLRVIRRLPHVELLDISSSHQVSDRALAHVTKLRHLKELYLNDTRITDQGVLQLRALPHLRMLIMDNTSIGDEGLKHISAIKTLSYLSVAHTNITDSGLGCLTRLEQLQDLNLSCNHLSDQCLCYLAKMRMLKQVDLSNNPGVTQDGIGLLKASLPHLEVIFVCPHE